MKNTQLILQIGLLGLGVLLGSQIRSRSADRSQLDKDQRSASATDSRPARFSNDSSRNRSERRLDSRPTFRTHKVCSGILLDRLVELHRSDFQTIMEGKEKEGIREFLILLADKDPDELLAAISNDLSLSEDPDLVLSIVNGVALKSPGSVDELIEKQRGILSPELFESILTSAFPAIARSDPRFAATLIHEITHPEHREVAMIELSGAWIKKDTKEALGWLTQVMQSGVSSETVERCYETIILGSLSHDPMVVAQVVSNIESGKMLQRLVPVIGVKMAETDLTGAIEWVKSISNREARQAGLTKMIDFHAQAHPELLFDVLVGELQGGASKPYLDLSSFTKHHADFVMKNLSSLPPASQPDAAESIALSIVERDGLDSDLVNWIYQLPPGAVFDRAAEVYALNQVTRNARTAVEFAGQIENPQSRANLLSRLVENAEIDT
ncbi:MAG: hypothetical protein ACRCXD_18815, partial [Luteolibacter sp.]